MAPVDERVHYSAVTAADGSASGARSSSGAHDDVWKHIGELCQGSGPSKPEPDAGRDHRA